MSHRIVGFCLLLALLGCRGIGSRGPAKESLVDTELARPIPPAPAEVVPEKPQKGFEQESPKAQSP